MGMPFDDTMGGSADFVSFVSIFFMPRLSGYSTALCKRLSVFCGLAIASTLAACSSSLPNAYEARLADHLTNTGAKMYGAYWCPHCATQKTYFGGAANRIPYVECDPKGLSNQAELCEQLEIAAYPTWVIEDNYYLGAQSLRTLERLSGFEGATADESDVNATGDVSPAPQ